MSTVESVGATRSTLRSASSSAGLLPTISLKLCWVRISSCRYTFSASSRFFSASTSDSASRSACSAIVRRSTSPFMFS